VGQSPLRRLGKTELRNTMRDLFPTLSATFDANIDLPADNDIQRFLERDVRMILRRWPELKPALVAAYQDADPRAKRLLEGAVAENDPAFLPTMRVGRSP